MNYTGIFYALPGIGETTATKIKQSAANIKEKIESNFCLHINPEKETSCQTKLLIFVFVLIKTKSIIEDINRMAELEHQVLQNSIIPNEIITSFKKWYWANQSVKDCIISLKEHGNKFLASKEKEKIVQLVKEFKTIVDKANCDAWNDFKNNTAPYYAFLEKYSINGNVNVDNGITKEFVEKINNISINNNLLRVSLRGYQLFGTKYILLQKKVLLGDEMGLGKTIQAISVMANLQQKSQKTILVICPSSVLINWCREIEKHSKLIALPIYSGKFLPNYELWKQGGYVGVVTYEGIKKFFCIDDVNSLKVDMVVVDEAHYIKNPTAKRTENVLQILKKAQYRLLMTGTPLENNLNEMCTLIGYLQPFLAYRLKNLYNNTPACQFKNAISSVYLRRTRKDVLKELPQLINCEEWGDLNPVEEAAYERSVMSGNYMSMRRVSFDIDNPNKSTKIKRLLEICSEAREEGRKIVVFSFFRNTLFTLKEVLQDKTLDIISGSITPIRRQEILDEFELSQAGTILLSQIMAGGTGLNIQCASTVILCEPQFKPSTENQAISRVYRMGQARNVEVHRLLLQNCIDERLVEILKKKQHIFDLYVDESVAAKNDIEVSESEIVDIVKAEQKRLNIHSK